MEAPYKERQRVNYNIPLRGVNKIGTGDVVEVVWKPNGWHIVIFDKKNNRTVTARPVQVSPVRRKR